MSALKMGFSCLQVLSKLGRKGAPPYEITRGCSVSFARDGRLRQQLQGGPLGGKCSAAAFQGACSVYVLVPEDGSYEGKVRMGSGAARAIVTAFVPYTSRAERGAAHESHDAAMASAAAGGFTHWIEPTS